MSFLASAQLAKDPDFLLRVEVALVTAATNISAETQTNFLSYYKRHNYSQDVLRNSQNRTKQIAIAVVANPAIAVDSDDGAIQYTVNTLMDAFAGVIPSDLTTPVAVPQVPITP